MDYQTYFKNEITIYPEWLNTYQMMEICNFKSKKSAYQKLKKGGIEYHSKGRLHQISRDSLLQHLYKSKYLEESDTNLKEFYENLFLNEPDTLKVIDICRITGYVKASVQRWILSGNLEAFKITTHHVVPKTFLITFMVSRRFRSIQAKSELHKKYIENFERTVLL